MTTLLDKKRSATSNVQNPDEATLDQVLSRISALAPVVAQYVRDMEQDRRLPKELVSALCHESLHLLKHLATETFVRAQPAQFRRRLSAAGNRTDGELQ
jgi:hypothetical protein